MSSLWHWIFPQLHCAGFARGDSGCDGSFAALSESGKGSESDPIRDYLKHGREINTMLRGVEKQGYLPISSLRAKWMTTVSELDKKIAEALPLQKESIAYRGERSSGGGIRKVGEIFQEASFYSMSKKEESAMDFALGKNPVLYRMHLPKGQKLLSVSGADEDYEQEAELLGPRNMKFKVLSRETQSEYFADIEQYEDVTYVDLEVVL